MWLGALWCWLVHQWSWIRFMLYIHEDSGCIHVLCWLSKVSTAGFLHLHYTQKYQVSVLQSVSVVFTVVLGGASWQDRQGHISTNPYNTNYCWCIKHSICSSFDNEHNYVALVKQQCNHSKKWNYWLTRRRLWLWRNNKCATRKSLDKFLLTLIGARNNV